MRLCLVSIEILQVTESKILKTCGKSNKSKIWSMFMAKNFGNVYLINLIESEKL